MIDKHEERVIMRRSSVEIGLTVGTMLDAPQLDWLYYLARLAPSGPAVEVGVWKGGSIICWARARRGRGSVHAVDTWYGDAKSETRRKFLRNAGASGLGIELIELAGHQAAALFHDGTVAFCFIDADHGEGGITRDLPAWVPKIMPGGILAFHDFRVWKPTVVVEREVNAWQARDPWEKMGLVGSAIAFRCPAAGPAPPASAEPAPSAELAPDADCTEAGL